jgi:O-methyltransferase
MKIMEDGFMLTESENQILTKLLDGRASLSEGLQLYNQLTERGIPFRMEWEKKILELALAEEPDRYDLVIRYRQVLLTLGHSIPESIELRYAEMARNEEYNTDHQNSAEQYNEKTGMSNLEPEFLSIAEKVRRYTMTSFERMYALYKATEYIHQAGIPGDIVECGVWRGGSMMLVANKLLQLQTSDRNLYLFDTFEGLPRPDDKQDVDIWGNRAIDGWLPKRTSEEASHWAEAGEEEVRANMLSTGYPEARLHFVKGMVEETIPGQAPDEIALLRLDTDWYQSTKHELEHLFKRLSPHGILIIDDYGHFQGARKAVDDFFRTNRIPILLNRIDYAGRLAIKTH